MRILIVFMLDIYLMGIDRDINTTLGGEDAMSSMHADYKDCLY
jgi:hypothetical protein